MSLLLKSLIGTALTIDGTEIGPYETQTRMGASITTDIGTAVGLRQIQCDVLSECGSALWADNEGTSLVAPDGTHVPVVQRIPPPFMSMVTGVGGQTDPVLTAQQLYAPEVLVIAGQGSTPQTVSLPSAAQLNAYWGAGLTDQPNGPYNAIMITVTNSAAATVTIDGSGLFSTASATLTVTAGHWRKYALGYYADLDRWYLIDAGAGSL